MELWYSEFHTENVKLSVRVDLSAVFGESWRYLADRCILSLLSLENL